ncbi:M1 family aminopeptidase [Dictyobacter arantiisoli]|uniref:Aminopeptidase N n=1 Tax=Dictyobacter arantiisoli TaxID=2014874 RepID=A0A5A5TJP1_9CHLR|nr:M1 family aminopeptidase [Dictyobacter arantiisoli]GCF11831.1 aminopeptidase [Dictyobacter arantiisoli]
MASNCTRAQALELGNGYSLLMFNELHALPSPKSRSFEFPGDQLKFAPDRPADVRHVKLDITLDFEQETISGTAYTTFSALYEEVTTVSLDAEELHIEQVALANGTKLNYSTTNQKLIIILDRPYKHGEEFTVAVTYHAKPRTGIHFMKPAPEDPTRPIHAWTFGQPRYHSHWFPCHDSPDDRATTEIIVTVPAQFITVSNGNLLGVTDNGATKTHHWRHDVPHAAYLVSLVVGDFAVIEDTYKGKPVHYYVRKDRKEDAPLLMGKTPKMIQFYEEYLGVEYPYDKYAQTVVEIYTGAMEHTSATTHSFALLPDKRASLDIELESVVAHELAHQWFGDLVTCRDWSNGWLNEGFATYFELLWGQHDHGDDEFKYTLLQEKLGYLAEDRQYRRPIVYYVYHDRGFELFDRHLYNKGAWVLHMLRHYLGDINFRRGLKAYLETYRTKQVVTADLMRTLEEVTGRSLERFFQQWVHGGGHPELEVNYTWDNERKLAKVKIKQTQKVDELTACFYMPLDIAFTIPTSDEEAQREQITQTHTVSMQVQLGEDGQVEQSFYLPLEREPVMVRIDPDGWLLKTLRFERPARMLRYQLAHDPDILGRIEAAQELAKSGEEESLNALVNALNNDPFRGVRSAAARALSEIGNAKAQVALIKALQELDPQKSSKVRSTIALALGHYQAPQQAELAQLSSEALRVLLSKGDVSYLVEASAAEALGQTRTEGVVASLQPLLDRPSWTNYVQRGIFRGLGFTGDESVIDLMARYAGDTHNHPTLRRAALAGLQVVGSQRNLYSEAARERAVTALINTVEHDTWGPARSLAAMALSEFGEKRAIAVLQNLAETELDSGVQRNYLVAAQTLSTEDKGDAQLKQLRSDLEEMREDNRKLREQLSALEARVK